MRASNVNHVELRDAAIPMCHGDILELDIEVVFSVKQLTTVHGTRLQFEGDDVADCFMEQLEVRMSVWGGRGEVST